MSAPNTNLFEQNFAQNWELVGLVRGLPMVEVLNRGFDNDPFRFADIIDFCNKVTNSVNKQATPTFERYSVGDRGKRGIIASRTVLPNGNIQIGLSNPSYVGFTVDFTVATTTTSGVRGIVVNAQPGQFEIAPHNVPAFTGSDFALNSEIIQLHRALTISDERLTIQPNILPSPEFNWPTFMDYAVKWNYNDTRDFYRVRWISEGANPIFSAPILGNAIEELRWQQISNMMFGAGIPFDYNTNKSESRGIIPSIDTLGGFYKNDGTPVTKQDFNDAFHHIRRNGGFGNVVMAMGSKHREKFNEFYKDDIIYTDRVNMSIAGEQSPFMVSRFYLPTGEEIKVMNLEYFNSPRAGTAASATLPGARGMEDATLIINLDPIPAYGGGMVAPVQKCIYTVNGTDAEFHIAFEKGMTPISDVALTSVTSSQDQAIINIAKEFGHGMKASDQLRLYTNSCYYLQAPERAAFLKG